MMRNSVRASLEATLTCVRVLRRRDFEGCEAVRQNFDSVWKLCRKVAEMMSGSLVSKFLSLPPQVQK